MKLVKRHLLRMLLLFYYLVQHAPDQEFRNILKATCRLAIKELTVKSQSSHIRRHLSPEVTITTPQALLPTQEGWGLSSTKGSPSLRQGPPGNSNEEGSKVPASGVCV